MGVSPEGEEAKDRTGVKVQNQRIKWQAVVIAASGIVSLGALAAAIGQEQTVTAKSGNMSVGETTPQRHPGGTRDCRCPPDHESRATQGLLKRYQTSSVERAERRAFVITLGGQLADCIALQPVQRPHLAVGDTQKLSRAFNPRRFNGVAPHMVRAAAVSEAGLMADQDLARRESVAAGAARRRVGDPRPGRRLHQVAAISACPVNS